MLRNKFLILAVLTLAGCASQSPINMQDVTITYKARAGEHPGEAQHDANNGASWEYWADHPTYILMGVSGTVPKLGETKATELVACGRNVCLR